MQLIAAMCAVIGCSSVETEVRTTAWEQEDDAPATAPAPTVALPPFVVDALAVEGVPDSFVDQTKLAMVLIQTNKSWGTGWVVAVQGGKRIVVTNHHVVAPALAQRGVDGRIRGFFLTSVGNPTGADATVLAADAQRDVAILKFSIADPRIKALRLAPPVDPKAEKTDDHSVTDRRRVVVVGFPFGNLNLGSPSTSPSLNLGDTDGEVKRRYGNNFIKVVAGIHPGNSGGPVLTTTGEVLGVATLQAYTKGSLASAARFNYAVPVADVVALAKKKKIDLRSDVVVRGGFAAEDAVVEDPDARRSIAIVDANGKRLACAIVASTIEVGAWLVCDPLPTEITELKGVVVYPAEGEAPHPVTMHSNRGGFSLFSGAYAPKLPAAVVLTSSALRELDVVKRVRATSSTTLSSTGIRVSSVRKDRANQTMHLLVDPGMDDTSPVGGVYITSTGRLIGVEAGAAAGTNLRAVIPTDVVWSIIDEASLTRVQAKGFTVRDEATGFVAAFPRLAARVETRYGTSDAVGVAWRSAGAGTSCMVEAWRTMPEPVQALLGRPSSSSTASRMARASTAVARVDVVDGADRWRITDGVGFMRVESRGGQRCTAQLLRTPTATEVSTLDAWANALQAHLAQQPKPTVVVAKSVAAADEVPVCGVWSWPKVRGSDGTFAVTMPCAPTRQQTLSGQAIVTKLVARPSPLHLFEVATWASAGASEDEDRVTSSYDEFIDSYLHTNILDAAFARIGANTDASTARAVKVFEGKELRDEVSGMLQTGTLRDGRRAMALATMTRGSVIYVVTAVVPRAEMLQARQFVSSFHLLVETDKGPAVIMELPAGSQMRSNRESAAKKKPRR